MILNGIKKIKHDKGDFVVLTDYGSDGISVSEQCQTLEDAMSFVLSAGYSNEHAIVKLVRVAAEEA